MVATSENVQKYAALQSSAAEQIEPTLRLMDCTKFHALAEKIGRAIVAIVDEGNVTPRALYDVARHDFNTFTHVTNVASYGVMLAKRMGVTDRRELEQVAIGAILHDVGKRFIPGSVLAKQGGLNYEERRLVEDHPIRGYEELCERSDMVFGQLMMIYQHHERVDGTGYPVRVLNEEIHPWARILAVVDVFDSLTARRPGRETKTVDQVLELQRKQAGTHFDQEVVECWISAMTKA